MSYVLLEDGARFDGEAVGAPGPVTGEVVFNTAMSGYQESMTDPSYARQLITFTYPHIGNYGVSAAAMESERIHARGAIMRDARNNADHAGAGAAGSTGCAKPACPRSPVSTPARWCCTSARPGRCAAGSSRPTAASTKPRR